MKNLNLFINSSVFLKENDMDNIHKRLEIASRNYSIAAFVTQKSKGDFDIPIFVLNKSAVSDLRSSTMKAKIRFFLPSSGAAFQSNDHHIKNESKETYASVTSQDMLLNRRIPTSQIILVKNMLVSRRIPTSR